MCPAWYAAVVAERVLAWRTLHSHTSTRAEAGPAPAASARGFSVLPPRVMGRILPARAARARPAARPGAVRAGQAAQRALPLVERIMQTVDVKNRTAKNYISYMRNNGIIEQQTNNLYNLKL